MPLYLFDVVDTGVVGRDESGVGLTGFDEAWDQAVVRLPDIARHESSDGESLTLAGPVRDERDRMV